MLMESEVALNLATLPADIIRMILLFERPEHIVKMRLVSQSWNNNVQGYLEDKYQLPSIALLECEIGTNQKGNLKLKMLTIWEKLEDNFKVWRRSEENGAWFDMRIMRKIRFSSEVDKLDLNYNNPLFETLDTLPLYLGDVFVRSFYLTAQDFNEKTRKFVIDLIRINCVQQFTAKITNIDIDSLRAFIIDATQVLQSIEIIEKASSSSYFGISGEIWRTFAKEINCSNRFVARFHPETDPNSDNLRIRVHVAFNKTHVSLAMLPADIIQKLLQLEEPELVDYMRLISFHWNSQVVEYINNKKRFSAIKSVSCQFEFEPWIREFCISWCKRRCRTKCEHQPFSKYTFFEENSSDARNGLVKRKFQRCLMIEKLKIFSAQTIIPEKITAVSKYLGDTQIFQLEIITFQSMHNETFPTIIEMIKCNEVQHVSVKVEYIDVVSMKNFITEALKYLHSLTIHEGSRASTATMFGLSVESWEEFAQQLGDSKAVKVNYKMDGVTFFSTPVLPNQ